MARITEITKTLFIFVAICGFVLFTCEYLVYYVVLFQCTWPDVSQLNRDVQKVGQIGESTWMFKVDAGPGRSGRANVERVQGQAHGAAGSATPTANVFDDDSHRERISPQDSFSSTMKGHSSPNTLYAFFIADTHLLGSRLGHWFDKLRREWQMERAFQAALNLFFPDAVFVLGDLTDEGKWANDEEFEATAKRFWKMFRHPPSVHFHVVIGNHDVGFHNVISKHKLDRFSDAFEWKPVEVVTLKNNSFVLVNSMAFHGDNCIMCSAAMTELRRISEGLNCSRFGHQNGIANNNSKARCGKYPNMSPVSPILLQHFPLYRPSDEMCTGVDGTPFDEKYTLHGERREVLSKEASAALLSWVQPRLVLSAHTHHGCYVLHGNSTPEISVPSFSWRNRNNPSIVMATITPMYIAISKCFLPEESLIIAVYIAFGVATVMCSTWAVLCYLFGRGRRKHIKEL